MKLYYSVVRDVARSVHRPNPLALRHINVSSRPITESSLIMRNTHGLILKCTQKVQICSWSRLRAHLPGPRILQVVLFRLMGSDWRQGVVNNQGTHKCYLLHSFLCLKISTTSEATGHTHTWRLSRRWTHSHRQFTEGLRWSSWGRRRGDNFPITENRQFSV